MLSGKTALVDIAQFGRQHGATLGHALGFRNGNMPCANIKNNYSELRVEIAFKFQSASDGRFPSPVQREWEQDGRMARQHEPKTHGRSETRTIRTSTWSNDRIRAMSWPEAQQIFEIEQIRLVKGRSTRQVIYGLTSLTGEEASPKRLLEL